MPSRTRQRHTTSSATYVNPYELKPAVRQALEDYGGFTGEAMKKAVDKTAEQATQIIKDHAPVRTGVYKDSIAPMTVEETENTKVVKIRAQRGQWHLTHLLENGHKIVAELGRCHGKVIGHVRAYPHFKYGDEYVDRNLADNIKHEIEES